MDIYPIRRCSEQMVRSLIGPVTLFKQINHQESAQFQLLMQYSQIVEAKPSEILIEAGQIDTWVYFLLKGSVSVYTGETSLKRVSKLTPGEMFGDMAVLMHQQRGASVIVDQECRHCVAIRMDFSIFGDPEETQNVSLPTKLLFYRNMVHSLRWKIESNRMDYPQIGASVSQPKLKVHTGNRDTIEELLSLDEQAQQLAATLDEWNNLLSQEHLIA